MTYGMSPSRQLAACLDIVNHIRRSCSIVNNDGVRLGLLEPDFVTVTNADHSDGPELVYEVDSDWVQSVVDHIDLAFQSWEVRERQHARYGDEERWQWELDDGALVVVHTYREWDDE